MGENDKDALLNFLTSDWIHDGVVNISKVHVAVSS
jgi:hypothetical protein